MKLRVVPIVALATTSLLFVGCAGRSLPAYEAPLKRSQFMKVRTTAYTDTESDHRKYSNHNAAGTTLQLGSIRSAAADWARWPFGTEFLLLSTGQVYKIDDYGWALAGRNTIDLYCPDRREMNDWGLRQVTIQILKWGDPKESYRLLRPRRDYAHVRRMLYEIERFY